MNVLVVEDDDITAQTIEKKLKSEKWECEIVTLGKEAIELVEVYDYDIIILDLGLPDIDGYEVLQTLREEKNNTPVLILSGLDSPDDKIKSLGYGADDYLTKPYNSRELVARLQAIVRRSQGISGSVISIGNKLTINFNSKTIESEGIRVPITNKEYEVLELMVMRKGMLVSKETFLNHLYGGVDEPSFKIIDVFMCKLRKKLEKVTGGVDYIETIWGRGYMIKEENVG